MLPAAITASDFCMPLDLRRRLLGFSEAQSRSDLARCQAGVAGAAETR